MSFITKKTLALAWCFCCLLLALTASAHAITEAQFIEKVLARDKLLEEAQIGLDIKQIELDASRENYSDWKAQLSAGAADARVRDKQAHVSRSRGTLSTSPYTRNGKSTGRAVGLDFAKRFLSNPGSFSFGVRRGEKSTRNIRYDRDKSQSKAVYENEQRYGGYTTAYYAQINYPLLKRGGNAESLKTYHRNIFDLQEQRLVFLETKEDFLNQRLDDFLSWLRYHRRVQINHELLQALRQLQPTDEAEAALLASVIAQTENAKRDEEIQRQAIVELLAVLLDDANLLSETPDYNLQKRAVLIRDNLRDYLSRHSRDLQRIDIDKKLNQLEIDHQKNRLLPTLNLTLRAAKEFDRSGTATQRYDDDTTNYRAGLEFVYPLGGDITTNAELAKRALGMRRLEIGHAERMERISGDLQRLTSLLDWEEPRLLAAIAAAEQSRRLEQQKYQQTRASVRDLVQAHRDERAAKLDHVDSLIEYQMHSIEYDNLLDRMIVPMGL